MHGARATLAARAMHIEKHRTIALAQIRSVEPDYAPANRIQHTGRYVSWNYRIWDAGQAAVPQVNIGAAHLRARGTKERPARGQFRTRKLPDLNRLPGRGHHRGKDR